MVLPNPIGNLMLKVNGGTPCICCCSKILRRCADGGGDGSNEMVDSANMVAKFKYAAWTSSSAAALASDTAEAT